MWQNQDPLGPPGYDKGSGAPAPSHRVIRGFFTPLGPRDPRDPMGPQGKYGYIYIYIYASPRPPWEALGMKKSNGAHGAHSAPGAPRPVEHDRARAGFAGGGARSCSTGAGVPAAPWAPLLFFIPNPSQGGPGEAKLYIHPYFPSAQFFYKPKVCGGQCRRRYFCLRVFAFFCCWYFRVFW